MQTPFLTMILGMTDETIAERAKRLRKLRGFTQLRLGTEAKVDPSTISRLELGTRTPDIATLRQIAEALGVPLAELLGSTGDDSDESMYPSLRAFLTDHPDFGVTSEERAWLVSQRFAPHLGDLGSDVWWVNQLYSYRGFTKKQDVPPELVPPLSKARRAPRP